MRIGILTGGGDCPGLNAVIRAVVRTCDGRYGSSVVGFQDGWRGLLEKAWLHCWKIEEFGRRVLRSSVPVNPMGDTSLM